MSAIERLPIETVRRYATQNVISSFLVWGIALAGANMIMPVMYGNISEVTGWTIGQTTAFMVIKSAVSAIFGFFAGALFVKFGLKRTYIAGVATIGISTTLLYFTHSLWMYYTIAAISAVGSIVSLVAFQATLSKWYSARLGAITGFALLGGAVAGAILPMATAYLIKLYNWQTTCGIMGLITLVIVTTAVVFLVRETPETYGYTADELDPGKVPIPQGEVPGEDFKTILKSRSFILILLGVFASGAFSNGINEHLPLFLARQTHLGQYMAALGLTVVLVVSGGGKIFFGWLFDRFSMKALAACWALCGIAVVLAFPVSGLVSFVAFTVVRGLAQGGVIVQGPIIARHMFGVKAVTQVIAFISATFYLGAAFGVWAIGLAYDKTGSYFPPFIAVVVVAFVAALLALGFKPKYWAGKAVTTTDKP